MLTALFNSAAGTDMHVHHPNLQTALSLTFPFTCHHSLLLASFNFSLESTPQFHPMFSFTFPLWYQLSNILEMLQFFERVLYKTLHHEVLLILIVVSTCFVIITAQTSYVTVQDFYRLNWHSCEDSKLGVLSYAGSIILIHSCCGSHRCWRLAIYWRRWRIY